MKRVLILLLAAVVLLALILTVRTLTFHSTQVAPGAAALIAVDADGAAARLSRAIQFKTISNQDPAQLDGAAFEGFRAFLDEAYPKVHAALTREIVAGNSMLYTWKGSDPALAPILLLAHYDVVPVEPGTESKWTHPPFSGDVADGFVWGRGAIDFKCGVTGLLEAVEGLLSQGFQPKRSVYLAFGHDEELGGLNGAANVAALLKERGVKAEFSLDEGMAITDGIVPGVVGPLALIGLAEKGYVTLELTAKGKGGHSSNPPPQTTIGILASAIARLEGHPMPAHLEGPVRRMLETAGPEMRFPMNVIMANLWLFGPVVKWQLASQPAPNATLRTTTAPTIIEGGTKENVLPATARAVVNFRILPGDTVDSVLEHTRRVVHDGRVEIGILSQKEAVNPSPVADIGSPSYALLCQSVRQVSPEAVVAPSLTLGATDSKNYYGVVKNLYRLEPLVMNTEDLARIHGANERVAIDNYTRLIQIYAQVIRNACE
jgi:carboxypeptidase PM20D1